MVQELLYLMSQMQLFFLDSLKTEDYAIREWIGTCKALAESVKFYCNKISKRKHMFSTLPDWLKFRCEFVSDYFYDYFIEYHKKYSMVKNINFLTFS